MDTRQELEDRLAALAPLRMRLDDESHRHNVPAGAASHWNLILVSECFEGKNALARHREVHAALGNVLRGKIHALTMKLLTPEEWEAAGGEVTHPAPPCLGGGKPR